MCDLFDLFELSDLSELLNVAFTLAPPLDLPDLLLPRQEEVLVRLPPRAEVGSVGSGVRAGQRHAGLSRRRARLRRGVRRGVPGETFVFIGIPPHKICRGGGRLINRPYAFILIHEISLGEP